MYPRVKICGITRIQDGLDAAARGADAVGLVFYSKSPRHIGVERAVEIVQALPPFVTTVGLFVNAERAEVESVLNGVKLDLLQFHGEEAPDFCRGFGLPYLKAVRVKPGLDLLQYATRYQDAKGLLLDAYVEGTHGGTGATFDWTLIPSSLPLPIILSGGLTPSNVAEAIRAVHPWAVDVSSGVEAEKGIKDPVRVAAFMEGVRNAYV